MATSSSAMDLDDDTQSQYQKSVPVPTGATSKAQPTNSLASSPVSAVDKGLLIPYKDVTAAFAVDVSSSTSLDGILTQEKEAVLALSAQLSREAEARARVLPWDKKASPPIKTPDVIELRPGWGTDPTALIDDRKHQNILRHCSLWFLLTDGEIDRRDIHEFALGVGEKKLHGKACVVILFGIRPSRPAYCNISVGQAAFAVAPDCAFLFHDVSTEEVYILQCKGCFRALLPSEKAEIVIDEGVFWKDIPRTSYDKLAHIAVPRPREVDNNAIILENGGIVHLDDLYGDKLSPASAAEILDSDDNLKSVLLASQNKGKSTEIENWISKQRVSRKDTAYIDRPDLDGSALRQVKALVTAMKETIRHSDLVEALQHTLRVFHHRNWNNFICSIGFNSDSIERRNTVVDYALDRVRFNRQSPSSPSMMSPVSPFPSVRSPVPPRVYNPSSLKSAQRYRLAMPYPQRFRPARNPPPPPRLRHVELPVRAGQNQVQTSMSPVQSSPYEPPAQHTPRSRNSQTSPYFPQSPFPNNPELSQLLYMKGYKVGSGPAAAQPFCGYCPLCGDGNSVLALLLKARPPNGETEGDFPAPGSHSDIRFPLAMGNFSETDIISSFLGCEKCAHFLRIIGTSPLDDSIKGAIPLVPLSNEMNHDSVLKEIDTALENRFNRSILDQTFLSILYSKLDEVTANDGSRLLADALRWQCRNFFHQISLPASLSSSFDPTEQPVYRPLSTTMSAILPSLDEFGHNSLIQYPVDGFVTLLKGSLDLGLVSASDDVVKKAVFQRLLFHLVEQQAMLGEQEGNDTAAEELRRILLDHPAAGLDFDRLEGTYLLDEDTYQSFQRLKNVFECVRQDCRVAVWSFLRLMGSTPWEERGPEEFFTAVRAGPGVQRLFSEPWKLRESDLMDLE
ncbi:MAG: hypothetical protein Q9181_006412 [Wetmoreana brouardii]